MSSNRGPQRIQGGRDAPKNHRQKFRLSIQTRFLIRCAFRTIRRYAACEFSLSTYDRSVRSLVSQFLKRGVEANEERIQRIVNFLLNLLVALDGDKESRESSRV